MTLDLEKLNKSKMKNGQTVEDNLVALIAKMGEKITIGRVKTFNHSGAKILIIYIQLLKIIYLNLAVVVSIRN